MSWVARQTRHIYMCVHSFVSSPYPYSNFHLEKIRIEKGTGFQADKTVHCLSRLCNCACPMYVVGKISTHSYH